ncbi:UNVERIFIED_CONTAM: hypothetical protein Sindi_2848200 [Sesamum indicum]
MEEHSRENMPGLETTLGTGERTIQLTWVELQQMMEEAGRNAIVAYERRTTTPIERETAKKRLFKEKDPEKISEGTSRKEIEKEYHTPSEVGSSSCDRSHQRGPAISRAEVDNMGKQIAMLGKQIDELKRRGDIVSHNRNSPFCNKILTEVVNLSFRMPDLPKYDGTKDPQKYVAAFDLKGVFASALARDPPADVEQLMALAQKYIDEEEMNAMKDEEWRVTADSRRGRDRNEREGDRRSKQKKFTPAKKYSNKYCRFHKERGHDTKECYQLKNEIERLVRQEYFKAWRKGRTSAKADREAEKANKNGTRKGRTKE